MTRNPLSMIGVLAVLGFAGLAQADEILYENTFESGPMGSEWSSNSVLVNEGAFTRFNGRYTNDATVLTLVAVPNPGGMGGDDNNDNDGGSGGDGGGGDDDGGNGGGGSQYVVYALEFDFYAIDSWDGDDAGHGPDTFEVSRDGDVLFSETFANTHLGQSFRRPDVGPEKIGFAGVWEDSIYRDITLEFELSEDAESFSLSFEGIGLQSMSDESWGIDNVRVSYNVVPAPATLSAGGLMLLLGGRRKRS